MPNTKTHLLTFALTAAFCAVPSFSILARAQDAPKQEQREEETDKKTTEERKADKAKHDKKATREEDVKKEDRDRERDHAAQENRDRDTHNQGTEAHAQRPAQNVHYRFRSDDRSKLRQHFQAQIAHVDRANRPHITRETVIDVTYRTYIEPVPQDVVVLLAPPPPGYVFGFLDGFVIIYDPGTFFVVDFIDLL